MAMDFISGPTTVATTTPRTPDSDTDTPPHPPPAKRSHHHNHHQQHVSYKECLKNHAASIGGHALDGCCEFMPGPTANLLDPTSLTCAACGCHRNFHRRDPDDPTPLHHLIPPARKPHSPPSASQLLLSLSGHANSPSAPSDHEILQTPTNHPTSGAGVGSGGVGVVTGYYNNTTTNGGSGGGQNGNLFQSSKKRFRTKFSQEQKDKMHEFSEKIGWKLKKGEERLVEEFCKQVGVDRSVFKVWMHNNKHTSSSSAIAATATSHRTNITTATTTSFISTTATSTNGNHDNNTTTTTNTNTTSNVGGLNNCGGVLGVATTALEFNFGNGVGQEAKAQ